MKATKRKHKPRQSEQGSATSPQKATGQVILRSRERGLFSVDTPGRGQREGDGIGQPKAPGFSRDAPGPPNAYLLISMGSSSCRVWRPPRQLEETSD